MSSSGNYDRNRNSQEQDPQPSNESGEGQNRQSYNRKGYHAENDNHKGKSGYHDRSYKRNEDSRRSSSNNQRSNNCFQCGKYGHWKHECTDGPEVKHIDVETDDEEEAPRYLNSLWLNGIDNETDCPTNKPIMTEIRMRTMKQ